MSNWKWPGLEIHVDVSYKRSWMAPTKMFCVLSQQFPAACFLSFPTANAASLAWQFSTASQNKTKWAACLLTHAAALCLPRSITSEDQEFTLRSVLIEESWKEANEGKDLLWDKFSWRSIRQNTYVYIYLSHSLATLFFFFCCGCALKIKICFLEISQRNAGLRFTCPPTYSFNHSSIHFKSPVYLHWRS